MRRGLISSSVSGARPFDANTALMNGSSQYYTSPINTASGDFTTSVLVKIVHSDNILETMFSEIGPSGQIGTSRYSVRYQSANNDLFFSAVNDATGLEVLTVIPIVLTDWIIVTYTYTVGFAKLYINGALVGTHNLTIRNGSQPLYFGLLNTTNNQWWKGPMAMASLYSRELSAAEVLELANLDTGVPVPKCHEDLSAGLKTGLVASWNLGNTTGTQMPIGDELVDQTGNTNTMVAIGSPTYTDQGLTVECS